MADKTYYGPGAYRGLITDHGITHSDEKKTPGVFIKFIVRSIIHSADHVEELESSQQQERDCVRWLTPKTIDYVIKDLERLGFSSQRISDFGLGSNTSQSFVDQEFDFYCQHEKADNGNIYERWQVSRGARPMAKADDKQLRELDNLYGKQMKKAFNGKPKAAPHKAKPESEPATTSGRDDSEAAQFDDSDVPF